MFDYQETISINDFTIKIERKFLVYSYNENRINEKVN